MNRIGLSKIIAVVADMERLQREKPRPKQERDAQVSAAMRAGNWPALDGLNMHQRAAVQAAKK